MAFTKRCARAETGAGAAHYDLPSLHSQGATAKETTRSFKCRID